MIIIKIKLKNIIKKDGKKVDINANIIKSMVGVKYVIYNYI